MLVFNNKYIIEDIKNNGLIWIEVSEYKIQFGVWIQIYKNRIFIIFSNFCIFNILDQ
jgi:hypothetical protein